MENYEKLIAEIDEIVKRIKGLYDLAYTQYSHAVDEVISGRLTDEKQIEHILDGIIDFGDDLRFLELSKRLCRHIYYEYPQLVGSFVHMYRACLLYTSSTKPSTSKTPQRSRPRPSSAFRAGSGLS